MRTGCGEVEGEEEGGNHGMSGDKTKETYLAEGEWLVRGVYYSFVWESVEGWGGRDMRIAQRNENVRKEKKKKRAEGEGSRYARGLGERSKGGRRKKQT